MAASNYELSINAKLFKDHRFESFNEDEEAFQEVFDSKELACFFQQFRNLAERLQKVMGYDGLCY